MAVPPIYEIFRTLIRYNSLNVCWRTASSDLLGLQCARLHTPSAISYSLLTNSLYGGWVRELTGARIFIGPFTLSWALGIVLDARRLIL